MRKRLKAAWRAFRTPPVSGPVPFTLVTRDSGAEIIDAIRRHQRREGQHPTI